MSRCKWCGAPIEWAAWAVSGRPALVDARLGDRDRIRQTDRGRRLMTYLARHPILHSALDATWLIASLPALLAVGTMLLLAPRLLRERY